MFTKNIFKSIVVKWGFRPVEKRVHARVNWPIPTDNQNNKVLVNFNIILYYF